MTKRDPTMQVALKAVDQELPYLDNFSMYEGQRCSLLLFRKNNGDIAVERISIPDVVAANWDEERHRMEQAYRENALNVVSRMGAHQEREGTEVQP